MIWLEAFGWVWGFVGWTMAVVIAYKYDHRNDR